MGGMILKLYIKIRVWIFIAYWRLRLGYRLWRRRDQAWR